MSRYYKVGPAFWSDPAIAALDDDGRLLALYLLTCPHRTIEGLFRLPKAYVMADLRWSPERFAEPFGELLAKGFIEYDEAAQVCLIVRALKWQAPENPNQVKAAVKTLADLPPTHLFSRYYALSERFCERLAEGLREGLPERFGEGFAKPPTPTPTPTPVVLPSSADAAEPESPANHREDVHRLCHLLAGLMQANDPGARTGPDSQGWRTAARLLIDRDGRDAEHVERVIRWSQADPFWRSNVLSMGKLREKFPQLALKMGDASNGPGALSKYDEAAKRKRGDAA